MPSQPMIPRDAEDLRFQQSSDTKTYDTSAFANVYNGARCCLFSANVSFGLLLSRTVLPLSLRGALLSISLRRELLSAPEMGCRCLRSPGILPLLVDLKWPVYTIPRRRYGCPRPLALRTLRNSLTLTRLRSSSIRTFRILTSVSAHIRAASSINLAAHRFKSFCSTSGVSETG